MATTIEAAMFNMYVYACTCVCMYMHTCVGVAPTHLYTHQKNYLPQFCLNIYDLCRHPHTWVGIWVVWWMGECAKLAPRMIDDLTGLLECFTMQLPSRDCNYRGIFQSRKMGIQDSGVDCFCSKFIIYHSFF